MEVISVKICYLVATRAVYSSSGLSVLCVICKARQAKLIANFLFPPACFYAFSSNISSLIIYHMSCYKFNMVTVCIRVQSPQRCLLSWTIFQTEDNSFLCQLLI